MIQADRDRTLDPRTKLVLVLCISSLAVILQDLVLMSLVMLTAVILSFCFASSVVQGLKRFRAFVWIFFAMVLAQSIFTSGGQEILAVGGISLVSTVGLERAGAVIMRILIIVVSAGIMTTTNPRDFVQGLTQWRVPYEIAFMVAVAIRFLPLLREEAVDILTALQLRGVQLDRIPIRERFRVYSYLLMPMIWSVLGKSQELAVAVEMRGFRAYRERTSYRTLRMDYRDYLVMAVSVLVAGAVMWWTTNLR